MLKAIPILSAILVFIVILGSYRVFADDVVNLSLKSHYTFDPKPNYDLTTDSLDDRQLTDGDYVSRYFWSSAKTVGWQYPGLIQIEIDLGSVHDIARVCINTARGDHAGVSFPLNVYIFSSTNKKYYHNLGDLYHGEPHERGAYLVQKFCSSDLAANGRYVLLAIHPQGEFTFLDEIEVFSGGSSSKRKLDPSSLINRNDIKPFLADYHVLQNRKKALRKQVLGLTQYESMKNHARVKSIVSQLSTDPQVGNLGLSELTDELLALSRVVLLGNAKAPLIIWHKDPWAVFSPFDKPVAGDDVDGRIAFDLLQNGHASNAFILTNNTGERQRYGITTRFGLDANFPSVELREVVGVVSSNHVLIGDALLPIEDGTVSIKPGESKQIWMTVDSYVASVGEFLGEVIVKNKKDNSRLNVVPFQVKVWKTATPDESKRVFVNAWAYLDWSPIKHIPEIAAKDLRSHHINVGIMRASQIPWPRFKGGIQLPADYSQFDKVLEHQKNVRKRLFFFYFNHAQYRTFGGRFEFKSTAWKKGFKQWIEEWAGHLKAKGLGYADFSFYPVDEPRNSEEVSYLLETARLIKAVDPQLEVFTTLGKLSVIDLLLLDDLIDIYQVQLPAIDSISALALRAINKPVWVYGASGGKTASPLGYYRSQAWRAFQWGARGLGIWAYADAGQEGTAWNDFDGKRPDHSLVYEGDNAVVSSKRWEAWREGVEDYELLLLARDKLRPEDMLKFNSVIRAVLSNAENYRQIENARRYLLSISSR